MTSVTLSLSRLESVSLGEGGLVPPRPLHSKSLMSFPLKGHDDIKVKAKSNYKPDSHWLRKLFLK